MKNETLKTKTQYLGVSIDTIMIADAIYDLANAIREFKEPVSDEPENQGDAGTYLDGQPA